jgi:translation initiation factor IF-1
VIEALPVGRFRIQLANGHQLVARVLRRDAERLFGIQAKDELEVRASPGDMSHGTVEKILKTKQE